MSSKRNLRRRACSGKRRHPDEASARRASAYHWRVRGVNLAPYRCSFCDGWHIGHNGHAVPRRADLAKHRA